MVLIVCSVQTAVNLGPLEYLVFKMFTFGVPVTVRLGIFMVFVWFQNPFDL